MGSPHPPESRSTALINEKVSLFCSSTPPWGGFTRPADPGPDPARERRVPVRPRRWRRPRRNCPADDTQEGSPRKESEYDLHSRRRYHLTLGRNAHLQGRADDRRMECTRHRLRSLRQSRIRPRHADAARPNARVEVPMARRKRRRYKNWKDIS